MKENSMRRAVRAGFDYYMIDHEHGARRRSNTSSHG
jgi:hypothetical protein